MSHQDGLGDNGPETTRLSKPDDGNDRMEKKSENVGHSQDGIKTKKLKNSGHLRNSPTTRTRDAGHRESISLQLGNPLECSAVGLAALPSANSDLVFLVQDWSGRDCNVAPNISVFVECVAR